MTSTEKAIQKLEDKIAVLRLAQAELKNVADQEEPTAPKVRKTRQPRRPRGLSDTMPASEANHRQEKAGLL